MKKCLRIIVMAVLTMSWSITPCPAQTPQIRVKLEVLGDQNVDKDALKFMRTAMGALKHVVLVNEDPQVYIHVMARRIVTNTGRRIGYVMATATAQILEMELSDASIFTCSDYNGLWLETGPDLRGLCDKCVAAINYGVFDKLRKLLVAASDEDPSRMDAIKRSE